MIVTEASAAPRENAGREPRCRLACAALGRASRLRPFKVGKKAAAS